MALKLWLPLQGDLHNQGLSNVEIINNNAIINENGKIGKCYKFGTDASDISIDKSLMTGFTSECSVCFWLKINSWNTTYATFFQAGPAGSSWYQYIFGLLRNSSQSKCTFTISDGTNSSGHYTSNAVLTSTLTTDVWYHIGLVYSPGSCKVYLNGSLDVEYNTTVVPDFSKITRIRFGRANNGSYQTDCYMNDLRIYDHALSKAEVKEISKALILHYKLDNNGIGELNSNIIYDSSGYGNNGTPVNTIMYSNLTAKYNASINFNKVSCIKNSNFILPGKLWSVTCWYYEAENPTAYEGLFCLSKSTGVDAYKKFAAMPNSGRIWYKGETGTASISKLNIAEWTFLAMINDGTIVKIYQNAKLIGSFTTGNEITNTTDLVIGARATAENATSTSFYFNGQMSDFRIYATALDEEDILSLYHTSASIDKNGNVYSREVVEI